jgi:hypothetical protein
VKFPTVPDAWPKASVTVSCHFWSVCNFAASFGIKTIMHEHESDKSTATTPNYPLAIAAMVIAGLLRFVPIPIRPPNFAAVGALSLYSGARLPWWIAPFAPLGVMFVTDRFLWNGTHNYYVYGCYFATALVGMLLRRTDSPFKLGLASLGTGLMFFLVTNFGVWISSRGTCYPDSFAGLVTCYVAALPFYAWTVISDLSFSMLFFGAHGWLTKEVREPEIGSAIH